MAEVNWEELTTIDFQSTTPEPLGSIRELFSSLPIQRLARTIRRPAGTMDLRRYRDNGKERLRIGDLLRIMPKGRATILEIGQSVKVIIPEFSRSIFAK